MAYYHAVFLNMGGMEFGAGIEARSKDEAYDMLQADYPESQIIQLESYEDMDERENRLYADALDWDEEYEDY